jgi:hypothetical protein
MEYVAAICPDVERSVPLMFPTQFKSSVTAVVILTLTLFAQASAATRNVDGGDATCSDATGSPYCTIQAAINAAVDTDTVLVMPATYDENLNFLGKAITVKSDQGPSSTVIDGGGKDTVAYFGNGEGTDSVLEGFTLQNGLAGSGSTLATESGGGIDIENASPTIKNNLITYNVADYPGFGIEIHSGSPVIDSNTISHNRASGSISGGGGGAGIRIIGNGSAQIINNIIINNSATPSFSAGGGINMNGAGTPLVRNNFISGNAAEYGGGIAMFNDSDPLIVQNLIVANTAEFSGGGIFWILPGSVSPALVNNTIANNSSPQGSAIFADSLGALTVTNNLIIAPSSQDAVYCDDVPPIFNSNDTYSVSGSAYTGNCTNQTGLNGNISSDPLFLDSNAMDYRLTGLSPAIDTGDSAAPNLPATDFAGESRITGSSVDIGAYEYIPNPGHIEFSSSGYTTNEGSAVVTITVKRKVGATGAITVVYSTSDGTAIDGSDYTAVSGTIAFGDADMEDKTFTVAILDDGTEENAESFNLSLSNPTGGATLGAGNTATITIRDNDRIETPSLGESGSSSGCFLATVLD